MTVTQNMPSLRLSIVMILAFMVSACVAKQDPEAMAEPMVAIVPTIESEYDMNSWKSILGDECRSFFDGCNKCFREPGKMAACTGKACVTYQQPRCLDEVQAVDAAQLAVGKLVEYVCTGDNRFSVSYHEYAQDDQRVRLKESEIMFSDQQTHRVHRLQRTPSASGEQYVDSAGLKFFAKGDEALVMQKNSRLYSGCSLQR
ncbi:MAG TPA: MliC family protein [Gammaproteobacteria bacterium]|nr:MliC family protein [Gammaproteobacteria bacterium]